jgi:pilus assembly protein CpaB
MSKMRVVVLGVAVGSAALAFMVFQGMGKPGTEVVEINKVKTTDVLVAAKDIQMGERLAEGTLVWKAWPQDNIVPSMITKDLKPSAKEDMFKARARLAIFEGETLNEKKVISPEDPGFMSSILPKGMRALSVAISERSSAGGFILPNDRVDVILTRKLPSETPGGAVTIQSETVLANVRVLAVNQTFTQQKGEEGDKVTVTEGKTATLELDPHQSEIIAMVESAGELSLALRSIAENDGKRLEELKPTLEGRFSGDKKSGRGNNNETLFVRYGVEKYTSNR